MGEGYETGREEGVKLAMGPSPVAEPRGRPLRQQSSTSNSNGQAGVVGRSHDATCRDDTDSIESLGDKLLSPPVKEVVGGPPRTSVTLHHHRHHHAEEKSGGQPRSPSEVSLDLVVVDPSGELVILDPPSICDACGYCEDTCRVSSCRDCMEKRAAMEAGPRSSFTLCEIRRHRTLASCWLVAKGQVFDVTTYLQRHPAGAIAIARKAGGKDCTEDLSFHSAGAQRLWKDFRIGTVKPCTRYPLDKATMACYGVSGGCDERAKCAVM